MSLLLKFAALIDWINTRVGQFTIWLVLAASIISAGNAFSRYGFSLSSNAMLEVQWYLFAAVFTLCAGYTFLRNQHVRIDLIRQKLGATGQGLMDIFAMIVTNGVVLLIAYQCWPVLQKTIERGSRANTPLETPLWIPQGIWFAGWAWFALSATALSLIGIAYFARGKRAQLANTIGLGSELDQ